MSNIFNAEKKLCANRIKQGLSTRNMNQAELCRITGIPKSAMSQYISGNFKPKQDRVYLIAKALDVSEAWLMGFDVPMDRANDDSNMVYVKFTKPNITDSIVTFPVVGEIAAGYDHIAAEDWNGDTIDIPLSYLHGRKPEEFMVLTVEGDSMYPLYHSGDKVLILRQSTLNRSGEIGAVLYDGDKSSIKKVEYVDGEDWMDLVPINPTYQTCHISGVDLENCRILGIPKLLIREM